MDSSLFDPLSEAFSRNPYESYAALRSLKAPFYYEEEDTWMLTRMKDVEAVALDKGMLRNNDEFLSIDQRAAQQRKMNWHDMPFHERFVQFNLLESEGDLHNRLRKLVFREFTPVMIQKQRDAIQDFVDRKLADLMDHSEIDFVEDFAAHVPGHIIGRVLGVPDENCPQLRVWSEDVVRFFNVGCDDNDKQIAEQATKDF
jgi:cytochrome P450